MTKTKPEETSVSPQSDEELDAACGGFGIVPNGERIRGKDLSIETELFIAGDER